VTTAGQVKGITNPFEMIHGNEGDQFFHETPSLFRNFQDPSRGLCAQGAGQLHHAVDRPPVEIGMGHYDCDAFLEALEQELFPGVTGTGHQTREALSFRKQRGMMNHDQIRAPGNRELKEASGKVAADDGSLNPLLGISHDESDGIPGLGQRRGDAAFEVMEEGLKSHFGHKINVSDSMNFVKLKKINLIRSFLFKFNLIRGLMRRMKTPALLSLALLSLTPPASAFATPYQISTSDTEIGNIILAKNCLDYTFCGGEGTSLAGGDGSWRLHAYMDLNAAQLSKAHQVCQFKTIGTSVSIKNLQTNSPLVLPVASPSGSTFSSVPNLYFPEMTQAEKQAKASRIQSLIQAGKKLESIETVIREYGLQNLGYAIRLGGDMGRAGAVTDHQKREIRVADAAFDHPCVLIETVRHELEHVTQIAQADRCLAKNQGHNLNDHVTRERSAYLNDIRTIPQFCPDARFAKMLQDAVTDTFLSSYTRK
jgi:hypothetical protein